MCTLSTAEIYFLLVLEAEESKITAPANSVLVRVFFLDMDDIFLLCPHMVEVGKVLSGGLLHKGTNYICEDSIFITLSLAID